MLRGVRDAAAWIDAMYADARVDHSRYYKEVYLHVGRNTVVVIRVSERRWPLTPRMLRRMLASMLSRGKERARRVILVALVWRLTLPASTYASRIRWARVLPLPLVLRSPTLLKTLLLEHLSAWLRPRAAKLVAEKLAAQLGEAAARHRDWVYVYAGRLKRRVARLLATHVLQRLRLNG